MVLTGLGLMGLVALMFGVYHLIDPYALGFEWDVPLGIYVVVSMLLLCLSAGIVGVWAWWILNLFWDHLREVWRCRDLRVWGYFRHRRIGMIVGWMSLRVLFVSLVLFLYFLVTFIPVDWSLILIIDLGEWYEVSSLFLNALRLAGYGLIASCTLAALSMLLWLVVSCYYMVVRLWAPKALVRVGFQSNPIWMSVDDGSYPFGWFAAAEGNFLRSTSEDVATVNENGWIKAVSPGLAYVTGCVQGEPVDIELHVRGEDKFTPVALPVYPRVVVSSEDGSRPLRGGESLVLNNLTVCLGGNRWTLDEMAGFAGSHMVRLVAVDLTFREIRVEFPWVSFSEAEAVTARLLGDSRVRSVRRGWV
ncbi:MAG: hypothetical protein OXC95_01015 [Dehalococcoidia bacterium]|nr:hypothetical protein [Dehalococcoidia bacterium]